MMKKESKKGQTMKFLDAYYDFSNGVAIYPFSENLDEQNFKQMNNLKNPVLRSFGVKPASLKQDYKAIETHKYTKEELALIEIQEIKREIQEMEQRIEKIERNLQSEEET